MAAVAPAVPATPPLAAVGPYPPLGPTHAPTGVAAAAVSAGVAAAPTARVPHVTILAAPPKAPTAVGGGGPPPTPPSPLAQTLTNFRVWVLCDGPVPAVARFVLAAFEVPPDGGVDAVRRALRGSALAAPPYNVFVRPWARVAYVKASEIGEGIRRLDNKQSDTMRALLAEEARSPGGLVLCVEQTRNPKYKESGGEPSGKAEDKMLPIDPIDVSSDLPADGRLPSLVRIEPPPPAPKLGITPDKDCIAGLTISDDLFSQWYALAAAPRRAKPTPAPLPYTLPAPSLAPPSLAPPSSPAWNVVSQHEGTVHSGLAAPPSIGLPTCGRVPIKGVTWPRRGTLPPPPPPPPPQCVPPPQLMGAGTPDGSSGCRGLGLSAATSWHSTSSGTSWSWGQGGPKSWPGTAETGMLLPDRFDGGGEADWGFPGYPSPPSPCSVPGGTTVPGMCIGQSAYGASAATCAVGWFVWYPYTSYGQRGYPYYTYIS